MIRLCFLWLVLAMTVAGLESSVGVAETGGHLRADGILEFLGPDGKVCATIAIEVADDEEERAKGLMWRTALADTQGMLFVYSDADYRVFWMRNTLVALDMIFASRDRRVINIAKQTEPLSSKLYRSTRPAQYVVEVVAGFCDQKGVGEGTEIRWRLK